MSRREHDAGALTRDGLEVRLLGGLELARGGRSLDVDLSRKTRALLGYLAATSRPQRRQALCDLFWQGPDDPRGSLRWSLSRIRKALGPDATCVRADGDLVGFAGAGVCHVDWEDARRLVGPSPEAASTEDLRAAADLLRGELLAGLDLDECFGYQAWCLSERERARTLRLTVLRTLVTRAAGDPAEALPYARAWVSADPLAESGHAELMRLLAVLGRSREALEQYELCRRILETEVGTSPSSEVERVRMSLRLPAPGAAPVPVVAPHPPNPASAPEAEPLTVGRHRERQSIAERLARAAAGGPGGVLLLSGDPGIGKSHLLALVDRQVRASGGRVFHGRAYEAEAGRAFGPWAEALGRDDVGPPFGAVAELLRPPAAAGGITALLLDDLQWADEASVALLHFIIRSLGDEPRLVIVLAARPGDLTENRPAARLLGALRRDGRLGDLAIGPLEEAEVRALAAAHPGVDASRVVEHSEGNPLFAREVARALERGDVELAGTLEHVIAGHLDRLAPLTQAVLPWTAALGRSFEVELLTRLCPWPASSLWSALEELERKGVLRSLPDGGYDFTHDLYRAAAYRRLSGPRRLLVHAQIAGALAALDDPGGARAAELARHAALAAAPVLAARACLAAGLRCQRLLAPGEAAAFADRGLGHLGRAGEGKVDPEAAGSAASLELRLALLRLKVVSGGARGEPAAARTVTALNEAIAAAAASGQLAQVASGHHALSVLYQEQGQLDRARQATLHAETAGRCSDAATSARQQANTARCLAQLGRDIGRARQLASEARLLADRFQLDEVELVWAEGLLGRWDGRLDEAGAALDRAATLAAAGEDGAREHAARVALIMLDLERGRPADAGQRCRALAPLSGKLGAPERAQVQALAALAALGDGRSGAAAQLDQALQELRATDSKAQLAYALALAGEIALGQGIAALAGQLAAEGLAVAELMELDSERAISASVLARLAAAEGDMPRARSHLRPLGTVGGPDRLSAHCRRSIDAAAALTALDRSNRSENHRGKPT